MAQAGGVPAPGSVVGQLDHDGVIQHRPGVPGRGQRIVFARRSSARPDSGKVPSQSRTCTIGATTSSNTDQRGARPRITTAAAAGRNAMPPLHFTEAASPTRAAHASTPRQVQAVNAARKLHSTRQVRAPSSSAVRE